MHLLDTNICIAFIKGDDRALKTRFRGYRAGDLVVCSVVRAELLGGARRSGRVEENLRRAEDFLRLFSSLPFDDRAADEFAVLETSLRRNGRPIGGHDALIAAIALANDATLVTRNVGEFARVAGLRVEVW